MAEYRVEGQRRLLAEARNAGRAGAGVVCGGGVSAPAASGCCWGWVPVTDDLRCAGVRHTEDHQ